jgi:chromate transporter
LPGPEAQQFAVYIGWLMHKTKALSLASCLCGRPDFHHGVELDLRDFRQGRRSPGPFFELKAAVLAIVMEAIIRIGRRALKNNVLIGMAAAVALMRYCPTSPNKRLSTTVG